MTRAVKMSRSFTCTPTRLPTNGMMHTGLAGGAENDGHEIAGHEIAKHLQTGSYFRLRTVDDELLISCFILINSHLHRVRHSVTC